MSQIWSLRDKGCRKYKNQEKIADCMPSCLHGNSSMFFIMGRWMAIVD